MRPARCAGRLQRVDARPGHQDAVGRVSPDRPARPSPTNANLSGHSAASTPGPHVRGRSLKSQPCRIPSKPAIVGCLGPFTCVRGPYAETVATLRLVLLLAVFPKRVAQQFVFEWRGASRTT